MKAIFNARREVIALAEGRRAEEIPNYKVKTPLQSAIQILKRHRDMTYDGDPDDKPISIIITTLAAHAYGQEASISDALYGILSRMGGFIENRDGVDWIANPTDPRENFADKWQEHPQRRDKFYEWLDKAIADFSELAGMTDKQMLVETMSPVLGQRL